MRLKGQIFGVFFGKFGVNIFGPVQDSHLCLHLLPDLTVEVLLIAGEYEVVRVGVVTDAVQDLLPVHHTAPRSLVESLLVLLPEGGRLHIGGVGDLYLVEESPGVQQHLPDVIDVPLPLVESLNQVDINQ